MSLRPDREPDDDPALEAALRRLSLADRQPGPGFTLRVIANLPTRLAQAPTEASGLLAWWRHQWSAGALVLTGLLVMLLTGDAFALLSSAWQGTSDWVNMAASTDAGTLGTGLIALAGITTPEAYLGLVVGAILVVLGAGTFVLHSLSSPAGSERRTVSGQGAG
ncbi:MAG: hypothetical protein ACR2M0_03280 [Chloroflexia bacterium]